MKIWTLRLVSLAIIGPLLPLLMFANIFIGNTLSSFGFLVLISGLLLAIIGVFLWVGCNYVEHYKPFNPFGLYLMYGGVAFVIIGTVCIILIPVLHSFGQQWVIPD